MFTFDLKRCKPFVDNLVYGRIIFTRKCTENPVHEQTVDTVDCTCIRKFRIVRLANNHMATWCSHALSSCIYCTMPVSVCISEVESKGHAWTEKTTRKEIRSPAQHIATIIMGLLICNNFPITTVV